MPWRGPEYPGHFPTLGYVVAEWIQEYCIVPDREALGKPYLLTDEQLNTLLWTYRLRPDATQEDGSMAFEYYGTQLVRPQKWGKDPFGAAQVCAQALGDVRFAGWDASGEPVAAPMATPWIQCAGNAEEQPLALDTEVPVPGGWTTVGALRLGDAVFDSDGRPRPVSRLTPILLDQDCYRVMFDDGTTLTTSGAHTWTVQRWRSHRGGWQPVDCSTEQMAADFKIDSYGRNLCHRYRVRVAAPTESPVVELLIDPWLLGLWLGDGATGDAAIALDYRLRDEYEALFKTVLDPEETVTWHCRPGTNSGLCRFRLHDRTQDDRTLRSRLRQLGVLGHKHIPSEYLYASVEQRLELLRGLIDSDGNVTTTGLAMFTNADEGLFDQVVELITSLGFRYSVTTAAGTARRVKFHPGLTPVAKLRYKASRQRQAPPRTRWRWVTDVRRVASVPVRCIGLNTDDHLFQVTRNRILTHNCDNTWRPIVTMLREGPLNGLPGLDVGLTRIHLPSGGRIEPVTASARARQGARVTFVHITEEHLMTETSGGVKLAQTLKRNCAGMDGRWLSVTNAWDPSEDSSAQRTWEAKAPGVYIDYRPPRGRIDLDDDAALRKELLYVYGDSARERGGWVRIERIMAEVRDTSTGEGQARRYFLNEVTVGSRDAVDSIRWATQARPQEPLEAGTDVCLGFYGSSTRESTSLCASRLRDGRLFHLRTWEKPPDVPQGEWSVPRDEVHQAVKDAWAAYKVYAMFCTPQGWQTEVNMWAGEFGVKDKRLPKDWSAQVLELWLNSEMRMDQVVERFLTAHRGDDITHDGSVKLTQHAQNCALADGKKRSSAEDRLPGQSDHYQRVVRKGQGLSISAFVAALLAYEARGWAIEKGAFATDTAPNLW